MAASCFAPVNGALCVLRSAAVSLSASLKCPEPETWTVSERPADSGADRDRGGQCVKEEDGNNDPCLAEISPYHLPFSSAAPSLVSSEMSGTVVQPGRAHSDT